MKRTALGLRAHFALPPILLLVALAAQAAGGAPDVVLFNGKVFTADPAHPRATALAIRGERLVAVGSDAAVKRLADAHTRLLDLGRRTVIPGLNDAHAHLAVWPKDQVNVETETMDPDWPQLRDALRKAAAGAPPGALLSGSFGTRIFHDPAIDRAALDAVVADHPVMLVDFDGHAAILNSAELRALQIGDDIADPLGGRFERDAAGHLDGVMREYAAWAVMGRRASAAVSDADASSALQSQLQQAAAWGVTTIQDMPIDMPVDRFVRLASALPPCVRLRVTRMNATTAIGPEFGEGDPKPAHPTPLVSVDGTKWVLDGVIFEGGFTPRREAAARAAAPAGPYSFAGLPPLFEPAVVEAMLRDSLQHDYQLQLHVFGRPAALELFAALEKTGGLPVWAHRRLRIEHGDGLTPELIAKAKSYGLIVSQQGTHFGIAEIDPSLDAGFLPRLRAFKAQPLRSLVAAGVPIALGSDGVLNPWLGVLGATTHQDRPTEAITVAQAVTAATRGSAWAEFTERDKGMLAPGKLADLAVLSQDVFAVPPSELANTTSLLTLVGGRVVHDTPTLRLP